MGKLFEGKRYIIYIVLGIILFSMAFKSQVIILAYGDDYSLRMEYTVYGFCIRVSPGLKAAEPAVYNEVYIGKSMKNSVLSAVEQLEILSEKENPTEKNNVVRLKATGFPRDNDKLEQELKQILENSGRKVELFDEIEIN